MSMPKGMSSLFLLMWLLPFSPNHVAQSQSVLDDLAIVVKDKSREFTYTNKQSAYYYGETNSDNTNSWQGFNVFGQEFVDDYSVVVNGEMLRRGSALKTTVYPDYLTRVYPNDITEQLRLVDGVALFAVIIMSPKPVDVAIVPYFTDGRSEDYYDIKLIDSTILVARKNHLALNEDDRPVWLAIHGEGFSPQRKNVLRGNQFSPVTLRSQKQKAHVISFAVNHQGAKARDLVEGYLTNAATYFELRRARLEDLLIKTEVKTENPRFDKALAWAKVSLDALIMNQVRKGIFAGLPWFNNYWGRDTFISLPGATLVTGQFAEAKAILRSFAAFQQIDEESTDYGRVPNTVTTSATGYNTADGTPRFVMMAKEYVERSGDSTFIPEIYPVIQRSIEGTIKYHTDSLGFLVHGDAETWMDAVGPDGPWSPRGNRANDIQALWIGQLEAGIWFARGLEDINSAEKWEEFLGKSKNSFRRMFISEERTYIYDHLNEDGTPDPQMRPNQIFTSSFLDDTTRARVARTVVENLTYEHGVASLSQDDDNFHPYHQFLPYYPKDAAYHNGIVWTWVQGALISELCRLGRQDLAARITENTVHQILDRGAVGTQSELLDAVSRAGEQEPRLSGTFSQAWNLAEFIRNFYDDYLGVRVNLLEHKLVLRPRLPSSFKQAYSVVDLGGRALPIYVDLSSEPKTVRIDARNLHVGFSSIIELPLHDGRTAKTTITLPPGKLLEIQFKDTVVTLLSDRNKHRISSVILPTPGRKLGDDSLALATPLARSGLRALQGPGYPLLSHTQIKSANRRASKLIDADDPVGDDGGMGAYVPSKAGYTYPENPNFIPGCFDITRFTVSTDKTNAYFDLLLRALSNPGWHPEYGFQLTYIAIAIDEDGIPGSGQQLVPQNANFVLEAQDAFEKLILVGGGVQLEDNQGKILAAYVPSEDDFTNPLGDAEAGTISFAIPLSYLGKPTRAWTFTVLSGGQDDHGGAGLGEFRTVNQEASEWHGGGRSRVAQPNVYDVLVVPKR